MSDELEQEVLKQLAAIRIQQTDIASDLGIVKSQAHAPGSCLLAKQVTDLRLSEAKRAGIMTIVGFFAVGIVTLLFNILLKAVGK